jgi:hypothetical protein
VSFAATAVKERYRPSCARIAAKSEPTASSFVMTAEICAETCVIVVVTVAIFDRIGGVLGCSKRNRERQAFRVQTSVCAYGKHNLKIEL